MADCDRRCRCRFRAGVTRRPSAAGIVRSRAMACRGRCLSLRLALMPVAPVLAALVLAASVLAAPVLAALVLAALVLAALVLAALVLAAPVQAAPVLTTLGAIRAWGERAPEVLWFGRMR
jgi:hypothetical protein